MARFGSTFGAVLIGGLIAMFLSGLVSMQALVYYRTYTTDRGHIKLLVAAVWFLDLLHSGLVLGADWQYLILDRDYDGPLRIHWPVEACVTITAVITFLVISFYIHRLWTLSNHQWYFIVPITLLNLFRLAAGFGSTAQMADKTFWSEFTVHTGWLFAVGLVTSSALDFLVALVLIILIDQNRTGFSNMDEVLNSIRLYTIENGLITSVTTVATLVVWLTMPHNLIFLGMHFTIAKLYALCFLATLNARKRLQERSRLSASDITPNDSRRFSNFSSFFRKSQISAIEVKNALKITIRRSVFRDSASEDASIETDLLSPTWPGTNLQDRALRAV